jgi:uncharacterized membrane protein
MKSLISLALLFSASAQADIIKCVFTEPFISFEYSMTQSNLTVIDPVSSYPEEKKTVESGVSFQIKDAGVFELWDKNKNVVAELVLNYQGSDGMSDNQFPYSVKWTDKNWGTNYGGCTSNFLSVEIKDGN